LRTTAATAPRSSCAADDNGRCDAMQPAVTGATLAGRY
jgi:hypothetical protein